MKKDGLTLQEALKLLELYERSEEIHNIDPKIIKAKRRELFGTEDVNTYSGDYDDLIWNDPDAKADLLKRARVELGIDKEIKEQKVEESVKDPNRLPEIGDIAILKVKLRHNDNPGKRVYKGYEQRPVLVIAVNANSVDGIEITHKDKFNNTPLIQIGKLKLNSNQESYINLVTIDDYRNLDINYEFPIEFTDKNKPITKAEYQLKYFGTICKSKDKDEPYLINFNYGTNNYRGVLSQDRLNDILELIELYFKDEEKK